MSILVTHQNSEYETQNDHRSFLKFHNVAIFDLSK